jgi:hypothetical protein
MNEKLFNEWTFSFLHICEICALVCGIFTFHKWRKMPFVFLIVYLLWIVIVEWSSVYFIKYAHYELNGFMYTYLVSPIEFFFFFWLLQKNILHPAKLKFVLIFVILFVLAFIVEMYFIRHKQFYFNSMSNSVGSIGLLILIFQYFRELTSSNDLLVFQKKIFFYIAFGLFIYYIGSLPFYGLYNTLAYSYGNIFMIYRPIVFIMSSIMYLLFSFGFIWAKPN